MMEIIKKKKKNKNKNKKKKINNKIEKKEKKIR